MSSNQDQSVLPDFDLEADTAACGDQASPNPENNQTTRKPGSPLTPRIDQCGEILATPSGEVTFNIPKQVQSNRVRTTMGQTSVSKVFDGQNHCKNSRYNVQGQYIGGMETVIGRGAVINGVHGNNTETQNSGQLNVGLMTLVAEGLHPENPLYFERSRPYNILLVRVGRMYFTIGSRLMRNRGGGGWQQKCPGDVQRRKPG